LKSGAGKIHFNFCHPFFFTTNQIVFQNDIAASAVPDIFAVIWTRPDCMANLALLAKRRASGIMYIIAAKPMSRFKENSIEDLDCLNLNIEFCHKIAGKYSFNYY
jgi:hypothetical protein